MDSSSESSLEEEKFIVGEFGENSSPRRMEIPGLLIDEVDMLRARNIDR